MFSSKQGLFYALALSGHSVVLTGQGGTGKIFVLKKVANDLFSNCKMLRLHAGQVLLPQIMKMGRLYINGAALGPAEYLVRSL